MEGLKRLFAGQNKAKPTALESLRNEIRACEYLMRRNDILFDMETDGAMVDAIIYERAALRQRHAFLTASVRGLAMAEPAYRANSPATGAAGGRLNAREGRPAHEGVFALKNG